MNLSEKSILHMLLPGLKTQSKSQGVDKFENQYSYFVPNLCLIKCYSIILSL